MSTATHLGLIASNLLAGDVEPEWQIEYGHMLERLMVAGISPSRELALQMRAAADQLAAQIDHELTGLTRAQRESLRKLPFAMHAWADLIDPSSAPESQPHADARLSAELVRVAGIVVECPPSACKIKRLHPILAVVK